MCKVKTFWKFIGIYVAFLLQSLLFENLKIFSCSPDLVITLIIIFSVSLDFVPAAVLGAFAGLLIDVMYEQVFGLNLLIYMFFALLISLAADKKNENSPLIMSWISLLGVCALEIVLSLLSVVIANPYGLSTLCANIFVKGVFASVFTLFFVLVTQDMKKRKKVEKQNSEEEAAI